MIRRSLHVKNGQIFGRLTILKEIRKKGIRFVKCKCSCGNKKEIQLSSLFKKEEKTSSCGCLRKELNKLPKKHGGWMNGKGTVEYNCWSSMKDRCYNENNKSYHRYGGRGIKICKRWLDKEKGFENFFSDMGKRPKNLTIDRIDNDGNYEPNNCRWTTRKNQSNNRGDNHFVNYKGKIMTLTRACRKAKLEYHIVSSRIKYGWKEKNWFDAVTDMSFGNKIAKGDVFSRLTAIKTIRKNNTFFVKCKCECGNKVTVDYYKLKDGHTKSCGCLKKAVLPEKGDRFNNFTVLKHSLNDKNGRYYILCKCDCGTKKEFMWGNLKARKPINCTC